MKTEFVAAPKDMLFREFADLTGTYKQVCNRVKSLPSDKYWVRVDGFLHNNKEVHRVYLTEKSVYELLRKKDVFNKKD